MQERNLSLNFPRWSRPFPVGQRFREAALREGHGGASTRDVDSPATQYARDGRTEWPARRCAMRWRNSGPRPVSAGHRYRDAAGPDGRADSWPGLPEDVSSLDFGTRAACGASRRRAGGTRRPGRSVLPRWRLRGGNWIPTRSSWAASRAPAGAPVLGIDYRLAPEHPHPAAVEDAVASYERLLGNGIDPSRIVIAGDSGGRRADRGLHARAEGGGGSPCRRAPCPHFRRGPTCPAAGPACRPAARRIRC